jgi:hypothetical protein
MYEPRLSILRSTAIWRGCGQLALPQLRLENVRLLHQVAYRTAKTTTTNRNEMNKYTRSYSQLHAKVQTPWLLLALALAVFLLASRP